MLSLLLLNMTVEASPQLESNPPGVHVDIQGPVSVSGATPLPLEDLPAGDYRLEVTGWGFPWIQGRFEIERGGQIFTRTGGGTLALITPPGLEHFQNRESARGWLLLGAGVLGAAEVIAQESSRSDAAKEVDRATLAFNAAVSEEGIQRTRLDLLAALDEEEDEAEIRTLWAGYLGAVWLGAAVESWLFTPRPSLSREASGDYRLSIPRAGGATAAFRSALVPGSGQRYLGHRGRGNLFSAGVLVFGAGTLLAQDAFLEARRDQAVIQRRYDVAETPAELSRWARDLDEAADRTRDRSRIRWAFTGLTVGVYLWNVLDAGNLGGTPVTRKAVAVSVMPNPEGFQAGVTWRLPS